MNTPSHKLQRQHNVQGGCAHVAQITPLLYTAQITKHFRGQQPGREGHGQAYLGTLWLQPEAGGARLVPESCNTVLTPISAAAQCSQPVVQNTGASAAVHASLHGRTHILAGQHASVPSRPT
jgi:hypothetical protein